jgi:hypothetical protein
MGLSILVVPQDAFADSDPCVTHCCTALFGSGNYCDEASMDYMNCTSTCYSCQASCNGIQACIDACTGAFTDCGPGTKGECNQHTAQEDCEPGFNVKCFNSNKNCSCRWRPIEGVYSCVCQNITGG